MPNLPLTLRRLRLARHRAAAVVVVVMQLFVAASAIWEQSAQVRLGEHAEQQDAQHVGQHDEATCALCSVRSQTSMPSAQQETAVAALRAMAPVTAAVPTRVAAPPSSTRSRAPPSLPA